MITEDYCSFEVANLLKEKGFDEPCHHYYSNRALKFDPSLAGKNSYQSEDVCSAPTLQMAMKWFRTKHIIIVVQPEYFSADGTCSSWGVDIWADDNYEKLQGDYPKYEEACEAALKYSLENLI